MSNCHKRIFLQTRGYNFQRTVSKGALKLQSLFGRRRHPLFDLNFRGEDQHAALPRGGNWYASVRQPYTLLIPPPFCLHGNADICGALVYCGKRSRPVRRH